MTKVAAIYDYDGIERRLQALDPVVEQLVPDMVEWFREYVDVGEYGLAVEIVAERLSPEMPPDVAAELATGLLAEARLMSLPEEVCEPLADLARKAKDGWL